MDADKRHQLKQNELAEALTRLRDFNDPRFIYAVVALVAIGLGVLGYYGWQYSRRHALEQGWQRLASTTSGLATDDETRLASAQDELRSMIQDTKDPALAGYARLELATSRITQAFRQPTQRKAAFEEAATLLEQIRRDPQCPPLLDAAATFALASTYESLDQFDKAKELYQTLIDEQRYQGFAYKNVAAERLSNIDKLKAPVAFVPGTPPPPASQPEVAGPPITLSTDGPQPIVITPVPVQAVPIPSEPGAAAPPAPVPPPAEPAPTEPPPATPEQSPSPAP